MIAEIKKELHFGDGLRTVRRCAKRGVVVSPIYVAKILTEERKPVKGKGLVVLEVLEEIAKENIAEK